MNRLKSSMLIVLAVATLAGLAILPSMPVRAQGSAALSIPPRKNYTIEPGKGINDTLLVRNLDSERTLNLSMRVVDFTYTDDGGTPKLNLEEDAAETPWSLRSYLTLPTNVTIAPNSSESIDMSVDIPADHKAGSYYSAIIFSSSPSQGGNVGLSASGVSLVFVTIPGEVNENLSLKKLGAYDPNAANKDGSKGAYKLFNIDMPLRIGYTLQNGGNVAESPVGSVTLKNLFGKEYAINDINPTRSLALIGQTRTFNVCIKQTKQEVDFDGSRQEASTCSDEAGLWPGIYSVQLNGYYGWNGNATREVVGKAWFIYTPLWFLVILLVVILFLIFQGWKLYRFVKVKRGGAGNTGKKYIARGRK